MTIALKIGAEDSQVQGYIYLDAVTRYTRDMSGKVTSFPVDSGVNISDHFISENPKFSIDGIISDVDITGASSRAILNGEKPVNAREQPNAVVIEGQQKLLQYLPSSVKQFFDRTSPVVSADLSSETTIPAVQLLLAELMRGTYYNQGDKRWRNKMTLTTLYEMDGSNFYQAHTDLVITSVGISEDPDTGDSLKLSISLEQVRFASLSEVDVPKVAKPAVKKKATGTQNKGSPTCPTGKSDTRADKGSKPSGTYDYDVGADYSLGGSNVAVRPKQVDATVERVYADNTQGAIEEFLDASR